MAEPEDLWSLVEARADATPDTLFAVDSRSREISFGEFHRRAIATAAGLAKLGVGADTRVSWMLPSRIESLIVTAALSRVGACQNPILPIYRERELEFITRELRPTLLITPSVWKGFDYAQMAKQVAATHDSMQTLVVDQDLPTSADTQLPSPNVGPNAAVSDTTEHDPIRWIFYTSGTTASPKGVMHCDRSLFAGARGMSLALDLSPADRVAFVFPITHVGGIQWLQASLATGCALILIDDFAHAESIPTLQKHGVTLATAGTVFHEAYLAAQRQSRGGPLFPKIRAFPGGGAPKPPQLHHDMRREMGGVGILSGYGSTEAPILSMSRMDDPSEKLATTEGRPALPDVELRVTRPDRTPAAPGEVGELQARGPQLFRGYVDPGLNDAAFDEDGFFRTGDLGYLDEAGFVVITGRLKDVIIRKGENISAKEVEDLLYEHPKIAEVAVIGLPDPRTGERCCAVVTCHDPEFAICFEEMKDFLHEHQLMIQRIPEQLEIIDSMPRNATGKILKHELRKRFRR